MRVLIFDVETSGLPDYSAWGDPARQPHIVSLSARAYEDGKPARSVYSNLIRPQGFSISAEASRVNGITQQDAARYGVPILAALASLAEMAKTAKCIASFGLDCFDVPMVRVELMRLGKTTQFPPPGPEHFCVKKHAAALCKIPGENGNYKMPSLASACLSILGRPLVQRDPLGDLDAVSELFFALKSKGM